MILWILLGILVFAAAPILIPLIASLFMDIGHEGNSSLATMPWALFYTLPLAAVAAIVALCLHYWEIIP